MNDDDHGNPGLTISWDDLSTAEVSQRVTEMQQAQAVPLTRSVGLPTPQSPPGVLGWLRGSAGAMSLAGLAGALVTWGLVELVLRPEAEEHWYGDSSTTSNILLTIAFTLGLGLVLSSWPGVEARSWVKARKAVLQAVPYLVGGGVLGGWIASELYSSMTDDISEEAYSRAMAADSELEAIDIYYSYVQDHLHLPRGLAIGLVGVTVGVALGAVSRSRRRAINGAVGGFVGGFLGGFVFDYIDLGDTGTVNRLVATVLTGVVVGLGMGLVETARREHWLEIVSGGMAGKQFILYSNHTTLGASPTCDVTLIKDPAIAPEQARLVRQGEVLTAQSSDDGRPVLVNGQPVAGGALQDGDMLQLGTTVLRYRSRAATAPAAGPIRG